MSSAGSNVEFPIGFSGATLDTGNLGVSALCASIICGLTSTFPPFSVTLFDFGKGAGRVEYRLDENSVSILRCGAYHTKRLYRSESFWNIRLCARLGGLWNPGARSILAARAILDISGGDSFTDMYGPWRFRSVTLPKLIALEQRKPLILLPQTYGPFLSERTHRKAQKIVRASTMAWARDARSFEVLQTLLGSAFDPRRHRVGVDVAFRLPVTRPAEEVIADRSDWFEDARTPLVGLNVSGLLLNRPLDAAEQYGLKADYREVILAFTRRLLRESDARVLLIPHVVTPSGHYESDIDACEAIAVDLREEFSERVTIAPVVHDPCEVKWIIGQCDWFCGTRMHSTVAALSSGVPTAAISYSPKTLGVFETCGQGAHVVDPRQLDTAEATDHLWQSWLSRKSARESLGVALPHVLQQAESQMDQIVAACIATSSSRTTRVD